MTRQVEFDRVFAAGRRLYTQHFTLIVMPGARKPRLGMAIGRRYSPRAVARNQIKRLVREVFRHADLPPLDVIVTVRPQAARAPRRELATELVHGFQRLSSEH